MVLVKSADMFQDPGLAPDSRPVDLPDSNLHIVFSLFFWGLRIVTAERQQQDQEQIQDLKPDDKVIQKLI